MSTAVLTLSPAEQAQLEKDRNKMGSTKVPQIKQIRLSNKDMKQAPESHYFIELYKGKDIEPEIQVLGPTVDVVPVYQTSSYSYFTKADGLIAWTSDIHGYTPLDIVTLYVKRDGKVTIDFDGMYPDFKKFLAQKYTTVDPITGKSKKLLTFKNILYVLFNGEIHKLFVSNTSNAGVTTEGYPNFESPEPGSLQLHLKKLWQGRQALYEYTIRLGSLLITSDATDKTERKKIAKVPKPYYIMTFDVVGENKELSKAIVGKIGCEQSIQIIDEMRKDEAQAGTAERQNVQLVPVDAIPPPQAEFESSDVDIFN